MDCKTEEKHDGELILPEFENVFLFYFSRDRGKREISFILFHEINISYLFSEIKYLILFIHFGCYSENLGAQSIKYCTEIYTHRERIYIVDCCFMIGSGYDQITL